tara:strand:- start:1426 stop:1830 length:405 start_codon:yes stop_codon:yes gene_type:complete
MSILSQALETELSEAPSLSAEFILGGQTFKVGARPLTPLDFAAVNKKLPVNFQVDPTQFEGQVDMLIRKTIMLDGEGGLTDEKAFSVADRSKLMRMKVDKVSEMFRDLFGDQIGDDLYDENAAGEAKVDDAKGN